MTATTEEEQLALRVCINLQKVKALLGDKPPRTRTKGLSYNYFHVHNRKSQRRELWCVPVDDTTNVGDMFNVQAADTPSDIESWSVSAEDLEAIATWDDAFLANPQFEMLTDEQWNRMIESYPFLA